MSSLAESLSRRSRVLSLGTRTYLLSSNVDLNNEKTLNYIIVYYLNANNQFVFANIIDGSTLTNPILDISDVVITKDNQIIVADRAISRLIFFEYTVFNEVKVSKLVGLALKPLALAYNKRGNSLLVATRESINEHDASDPSILIGKYETDPSDNQITRLEVSEKIVAFTTKNDNMFLYQRNEQKINYLLDRVVFPRGTAFFLSQRVSYLYTLNQTNLQAISVSPAYLTLSQVSTNQIINVVATSTAKTCKISLDVRFVDSNTSIVNKQSIEDSSYKVDPTTGLDLNLKDYYGGVNLKYDISEKQANSDFIVSIQQVEAFDVRASFKTPEKSAVLNINRDSFYYIGINSAKENMAYVDLCTRKNGLLTCEFYWSGRVPLDLTGF